MEFEKINEFLEGIKWMDSKQGKKIYNFIIEKKIKNILELGFYKGKSTCYMAAALDELGSGSILTVDLSYVKELEPNIFDLLQKAKLNEFVEPIFSEEGYLWELKKLIEKQTNDGNCEPLFDFCYIDGAHDWNNTGFAFFLVNKLLRPGGYILFDDINYTIENSPGLSDFQKNKVSEEQRTEAQVGKVFSLLVKQHPNFENFKQEDKWGWAQKKLINNQ